MKSILLITKQPSLADAVQTALDPSSYQIIAKEDSWGAESLLARGAVDAIIIDTELTDARSINLIRDIKNAAHGCPILVCAGAKNWEWEEDAYLAGVFHVLPKPLRAKLLNALLARALSGREAGTGTPEGIQPQHSVAAAPAEEGSQRALETLRHFSSILTHSLNCEALLQSFLQLLREILGVNRAVIFLRKPHVSPSPASSAPDDRWLRSACALGLEEMFLDHFALSLTGGIGGHLRRAGRILRANSPDAQADREIQKEFSLLGAEIAIPILDRRSLVGVAVFDQRLTGIPYTTEELSLIFHMLEEVGMAIRNSWLFERLRTSHSMVADIMAHLTNGCVVISNSMEILHANQSARRIFLAGNPEKAQLEFSDLPQMLGSKVFSVTKNGMTIPPFKHRFPGSDESYLVTISPFQPSDKESGGAALLLIENITQIERAQQLEIEASNLRLIKSMAEHLAHEIGNSVVPLSTHQQLIASKWDDEDFRKSLSESMSEGVKRITRLANQMVFLARDNSDFGDKIKVADLISEAFRDAYSYYKGAVPTDLNLGDKPGEPWVITGDQKALRHALSEVILNALQANPGDPNVAVSLNQGASKNDAMLNVEVRDMGGGFSPEVASRAMEPFFSTRSVGLGLGLTVTRRVIENHHGSLEIKPSGSGEHGTVKISLPVNTQS
jgi:nitrogen-specific signal transduction histidine kinase/DNA-binding NarL/FixJ family response regulator